MADDEELDEEVADSADEAATSEEPGSEQDATQESQQTPKVVTMEDLNQFGENLIKRMKQSTSDQIKNQLATYNQVVKLQESTGHPISKEAQDKARQAIRDSVLAGQDAEEAAADQTGAMTQEQWSEYVADQTLAAFKKVGVEVVPGDPEWKKVEKSFLQSENLADHLHIAIKAAEHKKARLASEDETAGARTNRGSGVSSKAIGPEVTGHELFQRAHSERK